MSVDLSPLNGSAPYAIAYAFENQKDTCCNAGADPGEHGRHDRSEAPLLSLDCLVTPTALCCRHLQWFHRVHAGLLPYPAAGLSRSVRRAAREPLHREDQGWEV